MCGFWKRDTRVIYKTLECHFPSEASAEANEIETLAVLSCMYNVEKEMENEAQCSHAIFKK